MSTFARPGRGGGGWLAGKKSDIHTRGRGEVGGVNLKTLLSLSHNAKLPQINYHLHNIRP